METLSTLSDLDTLDVQGLRDLAAQAVRDSGLTHDVIAARVGTHRSAVSSALGSGFLCRVSLLIRLVEELTGQAVSVERTTVYRVRETA